MTEDEERYEIIQVSNKHYEQIKVLAKQNNRSISEELTAILCKQLAIEEFRDQMS